MANKLDNLKLQVAKPVENIPPIRKGGAISQLPEYQDAEEIIRRVKQIGQAKNYKWEIFDKEAAIKRSPEIRTLKALVTAFAAKVRELIEEQGVGEQIRLEQRRDKFYLVGIETK